MGEVSAPLASLLPMELDPAAASAGRLTAREQEVLGLILAGQSNRQIAERLFISPETVKTHVRHVLAKTGAARKAELCALRQAQTDR